MKENAPKGESAQARRIAARLIVLIWVLGIGVVQAPAAITIVEPGWGPFSFNAGVQPKTLPKHQMAPVSVGFSGRLSSSKEPPPQLTEMVIDLDRNAAINTIGLPTCARNRLRTLSIKSARRLCREAIIGQGEAKVAVAGQPQDMPLTLFHGSTRGGATTVLIHGVVPAAVHTPMTAVVRLEKVVEGRFGLRAVARIPILPSGSSLLDFSFVVDGQFIHNGTKQSFAMARCVDGRLSLNLKSFTLDGGERLEGSRIVRPCTAAG